AADIGPDILGLAGWAEANRPAINETLLALSFVSIALAVRTICAGQWRADLIAVGWAGIGPLAYNVVVSIGQSPFGRYTDAVFAWLLVTAVGSLLIAGRTLAALPLRGSAERGLAAISPGRRGFRR